MSIMAIKIDGLDEIQATFKRLDENLASDLLDKVTHDSELKAIELARKHHRTGFMERSMFSKFNKKQNYGVIGNIAPYATFVHFGTKPHTIEPDNKKILRWTDGNGFVFAKKVHHPGYKGDPFITNAINETFKNLDSYVREILDNV
jgi:hypothetical protein